MDRRSRKHRLLRRRLGLLLQQLESRREVIDRERGQAGPQGRGHLAHHWDEDDLVIVEEDHEGRLRGRQVEGRPGETPEGRGTEPRKNRRKKTMGNEKKTIRTIAVKKWQTMARNKEMTTKKMGTMMRTMVLKRKKPQNLRSQRGKD